MIWFLKPVSGFLTAFLFVLVANLLWSPETWGFVPTVTKSGIPIHLKNPIHLNYLGNPRNQSGLEPEVFFHATVIGLQRWKAASSGRIEFDYWQGTDSMTFPSNNEKNGISSIFFASQTSGDSHLSPNTLGLTQIWYNPESGEISEADILLNDQDFHFTDDPTDTTGLGARPTTFTDGKSNVYLQNVLTHELGHALGLSHSASLQSTMLYLESPEQAHLGCDDQIAIHALYPNSDRPALDSNSDQRSRGGLAGKITSPSGRGVFGANIQAISQKRGTALASTVTGSSGQFTLNALEPGSYLLMVEPFYGGARALPDYFSRLDFEICADHRPFNRTFLLNENQFQLQSVVVSPGQITQACDLTVQCENFDGASIHENPSTRASATAPAITLESRGQEKHFAFVDSLSPSGTRYYRLPEVSGTLEIHAISYSLYSPIQPHLALQSESSEPIPADLLDPSYLGDSGYINYDSMLMVKDLPEGNYLLQLSGESLQTHQYPAGSIALDAVPFVVITGTLNSAAPPLSGLIPTNTRCRMEEKFPEYRSPAHMPWNSPPPDDPRPTKVGFCGQIKNLEPESPTPLWTLQEVLLEFGPIFGWLLPWIFIFSIYLPLRLRHTAKSPNRTCTAQL